jgi:integrase
MLKLPKSLPTGVNYRILKRGNTGHLRYYAYVDFGGHRKHVPSGGWETQREAKEARAAYYKKLIDGYIEPIKMTFQEFMETVYLPDYANTKLSYKTRRKKIGVLKNYLYPEIGHIRLKSLGDTDCSKLYDLQHTYITYGLRYGIPVPDVQDIARHKDYQTTVNVYGHEIKGHLSKSVVAMEKLFVENDVEKAQVK